MPNIIEQQDLLKGLPDARLAMLLQNPVADIPPFLVAAEAQRRQALRQQFSGDANKESVVDSLTKQLAKVPQNIQAPAQMPPVVPPTPQMQGVAALQAQQAVQQAAQQAVQPQAMAGGGMVQRYQYGGSVEPLYQVPDFSYVVPRVVDYVGNAASGFYDFLTTPYAEREKRAKEEEKSPIAPMTPEELAEFNASVALPKDVKVGRKKSEEPVAPPVPDIRPEPGETPDQFRARLEALYAVQEPSDWEKAQRWFSMAEQFLDPSKTTMQSVAGAGQAFAQSAAEQSRAEREAKLARDKGMLEYDIAKAEELRAEKLREEETKAAALKARTDLATGQLDDLRRERRDIAERIRNIQASAVTNGMIDSPEVLSQINALQDMYDDLGRQISSYETFISKTYNFPLIETADLSAGQIVPPRR